MISAQATGVLVACVYQSIPPTSTRLIERFKGVKRHGKDFMQAVLKELENAGYIERIRSKVGNDIRTIGVVTEAGYRHLVELGFPAPVNQSPEAGISRPLCQLCELTNTSYLNSYTYKEYTGTESREVNFVKVNLEVEDVSGWGGMFESSSSDELVDQRKEALKYKQEQHELTQKEKQRGKIMHRSLVEPSLWTVSDIKYEFADRLSKYWNIRPWSVGSSRFGFALSNMRKRLNTNVELELKMIDMFFETVSMDRYDDAEVLWKLFISRADELASQARTMVKTNEQVEAAVADAKSTQSWLYE